MRSRHCLDGLNRSYGDLAEHYATAIMPATGVGKTHDKAKVEQGVLLAERWILGSVRTGASHKRSCRCISAFSSSCTTPGAAAKPSSAPSLQLW